MGAIRALRNAPRFGDSDEQLKVDQIETHGEFLEHDPEKWKPVFRKDHARAKGASAFVMAEGWLCNLHIVPPASIGQCG